MAGMYDTWYNQRLNQLEGNLSGGGNSYGMPQGQPRGNQMGADQMGGMTYGQVPSPVANAYGMPSPPAAKKPPTDPAQYINQMYSTQTSTPTPMATMSATSAPSAQAPGSTAANQANTDALYAQVANAYSQPAQSSQMGTMNPVTSAPGSQMPGTSVASGPWQQGASFSPPPASDYGWHSPQNASLAASFASRTPTVYMPNPDMPWWTPPLDRPLDHVALPGLAPPPNQGPITYGPGESPAELMAKQQRDAEASHRALLAGIGQTGIDRYTAQLRADAARRAQTGGQQLPVVSQYAQGGGW